MYNNFILMLFIIFMAFSHKYTTGHGGKANDILLLRKQSKKKIETKAMNIKPRMYFLFSCNCEKSMVLYDSHSLLVRS